MSDLSARKSLGQHFLHDPAIIQRIVDTIDPAPEDSVIEIGPGQGALTRPLLDRLNHLQLVEADSRFIPVLEQLAPTDRLTIHHADALKVQFDQLATEQSPARLVGNLPYNISTPLLFHFLRYRHVVSDMHLMLQKEVVDRMAAEPGNKIYGRLTVMLSAWTDIEACFDIGPGAFKPPPKVKSTVVRIRLRREPKFRIGNEDQFRRLVALAFSMRRKTLRRILKGKLEAEQIAAAGFDPQARPETLSPEDFARLSALTGLE